MSSTTRYVYLAALSLALLALVTGTRAQGGDFNFSLDSIPSVSGVSASSLSSSGVTISWQTNVPADSQVEYGTTTGYGTMSALDPSLTLSHNLVISGLAPSTLYHFRILSADAAGLLQPSSDYNFTTLAPATPSGGSPSGGGGGGGGGGLVASVPIDSITLTYPTLGPGTPVKLTVPSGFKIKSISLKSVSSASGVKVEVKKINSTNVPVPPGVLYSFVRIDAINTTELRDIEVEFDVPRSWLETNGFAVDNIKLLRYSSIGWEFLPTSYLNEVSSNYNFLSKLHSFSVFAIVGRSEAGIPVETPSETVQTGESAPDGGILNPIVSSGSKIPINIQYFIIAVVMFAVAIILYIAKRHLHEDEEKDETPVSPYPEVKEG